MQGMVCSVFFLNTLYIAVCFLLYIWQATCHWPIDMSQFIVVVLDIKESSILYPLVIVVEIFCKA